MKTWKAEAAIIAVGMVLLGVVIKWGINDFIDKERIVSVKGLAEMEVPADKVIWPLMYKDIGNDPSLLYANMEQKNKVIVKFLESNGIAKEEISIAPPEVIDMQAERYGNRSLSVQCHIGHYGHFKECRQSAEVDVGTSRAAETGYCHQRGRLPL